jgi:hypothetical protein
MATMVVTNQKHFFNIFLIFNYGVTGIATIKLPLCHSLVRSVILFNN